MSSSSGSGNVYTNTQEYLPSLGMDHNVTNTELLCVMGEKDTTMPLSCQRCEQEQFVTEKISTSKKRRCEVDADSIDNGLSVKKECGYDFEISTESDIESVKLSDNEDFNDLRTYPTPVGEEKRAEEDFMDNGVLGIQDFETSTESEIESVRLSDNEDFNDLRCDLKPVGEEKSHVWRGNEYTSSRGSSILSRGPIIPIRNWDSSSSSRKDLTIEVARNASLESIQRHLTPIGRYCSNKRVEGLKKLHNYKSQTLFFNNSGSSDGKNLLMKSLIDDNSKLLQSFDNNEDHGNSRVLERKCRNFINVNDSLFQTASPDAKPIIDDSITQWSSSPNSTMSEGYSNVTSENSFVDTSYINDMKRKKHAIIRNNDVFRKKILIIKPPRIIKPNEDRNQFLGLRRSKRNRIPVLNNAINQRPIYKRDKNGDLTLVGVTEVVVEDPFFVEYGTLDFEEIERIKLFKLNQNKKRKLSKKMILSYYDLKENNCE
uniref:RING-type domain-containing protein n=1 Tax=Parastrongyloides trichosuri TaxID=131310 RepID=A0A0N4ZH52_PARTI